jgi:membrane-bound serine protease (ClpP class)
MPIDMALALRQRLLLFLLLWLLAGGFVVPSPFAGSSALAASRVGVIDLEGPIGPASSAHVKRRFADMQSQNIDLVVLRLDTPGGLVTSMREIIKEILGSPVPVIGFVAPSGAHAASAGTYILYATHIAAMAPGTNLGAATPIMIDAPTASDSPDDSQEKPTVDDKIISDAVGYIRSLADLRGRNADWAERAVRVAASLPAGEALKLGVIDLVATNLPQLLAKLDGRKIEVDGEVITLDLADREIVELMPSLHTRFLRIITDPTVAYTLLMVGMIGLLIEVALPGLFLPGMIGIASLLVALYAFQLLPVSLVGLGIILLGVILMIVELTLPSFGLIGFSGIVAFVTGSIFLMDTGVPGYGVSRSMIGMLAVVSSSLLMMFLIWIRRLHTLPVLAGPEEMVGAVATVLSWEDDHGRVRMRGTSWAARFDGSLSRGQQVRVTAIDGLTVDVEPVDEEAMS